jgi:hypothetical protein
VFSLNRLLLFAVRVEQNTTSVTLPVRELK